MKELEQKLLEALQIQTKVPEVMGSSKDKINFELKTQVLIKNDCESSEMYLVGLTYHCAWTSSTYQSYHKPFLQLKDGIKFTHSFYIKGIGR